MELYAWYEPQNFTLSFTCNGESVAQYSIPNINATYDTDLRKLLPLDKIINENELIYSVSYNNTVLSDISDTNPLPLNEAVLNDKQVFMNGDKIVLDLKTLIVGQSAHSAGGEVCIKDDHNPFEQRFKDQYICDSLAFKGLDFELLEQLGYNTAIIEVSCHIREKDDGHQRIYIYSSAYENDPNDSKSAKKSKQKAMKDHLLEEFEHDCSQKDVVETIECPLILLSLSDLSTSDEIYVYYGADGYFDDDWYRVSTDITITFERGFNEPLDP